MIEDALNRYFYGNSVLDYLILAGTLLVGFAAIGILRALFVPRLLRWSERTNSSLDDFLIKLLQQTAVPLLYYGVFYAGVRSLNLHPVLGRIVDVAGALLMTFVGVRAITAAIVYLIRKRSSREGDKQAAENATRALIPAIHVVVWLLGVLYLLENLGFKVSAVVAGLGIGGIAVALAAQAVLGDLFSYFAILFDKPFEVGDFIVIDDYMGNVEHVGVKTTRLRSISGEELIFANTDLTKSRVRNYRRMTSRRVEFSFRVRLDTPLRLVERVPALVGEIVRGMNGVKFDRAHLASIGDYSLNYVAVYIVAESDYNRFMDIQQSINLRIMEEFERLGIQFASSIQQILLSPDRPSTSQQKPS
jgi:small-conductance mechanosensitive channel